MKYLKSLLEAIKSKEEYDEAVEFCQEGLAYLIDKGFKVTFTSLNRGFPSGGIEVKITELDNQYFSWTEVKDDIMSFLLRMNSEYYLAKRFQSGVFTVQINYHTQKDIDTPLTHWSTRPGFMGRGSKSGRAFTIRNLDETKILDSARLLDIIFTIKNKRF